MEWHIIEGEAGCAYAVEHGCVAVVVDALRAGATAAMLLDAGATELIVVREVEEAFAAKRAFPQALLFGERGGLPPPGFDYGNSPRTVDAAQGRRVIFTTTTGAPRLIAAWGAAAVYMGTTLNAKEIGAAAARHGSDVVLIPAGLAGTDGADAQEDWVAAAVIAEMAGAAVGRGRDQYDHWRRRIDAEGIDALFAGAPHANGLRAIGLEADVAYCAQVNVTNAVPWVIARTEYGVVVVDEQEIEKEQSHVSL